MVVGRIHLFLPVVLVLNIFSDGTQCVLLLSLAQLTLSLYYSRHCPSSWHLLLLLISQTLGSTLTMIGVSRHPDIGIRWVMIMFLLQSILQAVFLAAYAADRLLRGIAVAELIVFPSIFTGIQLFLVYVSPGGSWGVVGFCATQASPTILALLSLFGLPTVHFLLSWTAALLVTLIARTKPPPPPPITPFQSGRLSNTRFSPSPLSDSNISAERAWSRTCSDTAYGHSQPIPDCHALQHYPALPHATSETDLSHRGSVVATIPASRPPTKGISYTQVYTWIAAVTFASCYGTLYVRQPLLFGAPDDRQQVSVSCIAVGNSVEVNPAILLDLTLRESRSNKSALVLWSERPCSVASKREESELFVKAANVSRVANVYLGLSYELTSGGSTTSNLALVLPNGEIPLQVKRVHTSPFSKGPGHSTSIQRAVDTPVGKVGAIMGFDLSFPAFVQQVASNGVRIVISPAEDYGPIYAMQWNQAALRAVEQGTTVVQCSSMSGLTVVDAYGNTLASMPVPSGSTVTTLRADIAVSEITTPFSKLKDAFGWMCLGVGVVCLLVRTVPSDKRALVYSHVNAASVIDWARNLILRRSPEREPLAHPGL